MDRRIPSAVRSRKIRKNQFVVCCGVVRRAAWLGLR